MTTDYHTERLAREDALQEEKETGKLWCLDDPYYWYPAGMFPEGYWAPTWVNEAKNFIRQNAKRKK